MFMPLNGHMSLVARKLVLRVSDEARPKPGCFASYGVEISVIETDLISEQRRLNDKTA